MPHPRPRRHHSTDPLDEEAAAFYSKYGFQPLEELERMFLMMRTIKKLIDLA